MLVCWYLFKLHYEIFFLFTWHESPPPSSKDSFDLLVTLPNFLFFVFNSILTILKTNNMSRPWIRRHQQQVIHERKNICYRKGRSGKEWKETLATHSFLILFSLPPHNSCFLSKSCVRSGLGSTKWYSGLRQSLDRKTLKSEVRNLRRKLNSEPTSRRASAACRWASASPPWSSGSYRIPRQPANIQWYSVYFYYYN